MKLKTKLLSIIAPAAVLTTVAPIAITGCSPSSSSGATTVTYEGQKEFTITSATYSMEFKLDKNLSSGWSLICGLHGSIGGTMIAGPKTNGVTISGTKVTVACEASSSSWLIPLKAGDYCTYGLTFTCYDSSFKELWKVNIDGFTVTYQGA